MSRARSLLSVAGTLLKAAQQESTSQSSNAWSVINTLYRSTHSAASSSSWTSTALSNAIRQAAAGNKHAAQFTATRSIRQLTFPARQTSFYHSLGDPNRMIWLLIGTNTAVFFLWKLQPYFAQKHFVVSVDSLSSGRLWTAVTAAFSHHDIGHFAANMISLYFFGGDIARLFGPQRLLLLYLMGGVVGSLAHCGWSYYKSRGQSPYFRRVSPGALGASAAVNSIMVVDILLFPTRTILLYGFIPMPAALLGLLWLANDVSGSMSGGSSIAHAGHLGGAAVGLLYYLSLRRGFRRFW